MRDRGSGRLAQALAPMPSAKPIDELSADDLHAHPIWEYAMDEEEEHDETYVRPIAASAVPRERHVVYHAACEVVAATGKSYTAFMSICNGALHGEAPVVVGDAGEYVRSTTRLPTR